LDGLSLENSPPPSTAASKQPPADPPIKAEPEPTAVPTQPNPDRRFVWIEGAVSLHNPGAMAKPTDLQRGDLAPADYHFTPIQALAKYPYKYCNKSCMQEIASAFFDSGKFWTRIWDL